MTKALKITLALGTTEYGVELMTEQLLRLSGVFTVLSCYRGEDETAETRKELFVRYDGRPDIAQDIRSNSMLVREITPLDLKSRPRL